MENPNETVSHDILQQLQYAYLAGFLDGEGTIHFGYTKRPSKNCLQTSLWISASNNDRKVIDQLHERYGGFTYMEDRHTLLHRRSHYYWRIARRHAISLLKQIMPYLIVKREQASLLVNMELLICKLGRRSEEERQKLTELAQKIQSFNRKGRASTNLVKVPFTY